MKSKWKDTTRRSYDVPKKPADSWEMNGPYLRIAVHTYLNYGGWWLTCFELRIERHQLRSPVSEDAKIEALKYVDEKLHALRKDFDKLTK